MVPGPVQVAAAAALDDDRHLADQIARYGERRALVARFAADAGLVDDTGGGAFYLWLASPDGGDGWSLATRFAAAGTLVSPGDLYGPAGARHVRVAVVQPLDRLQLAVDRLAEQLAGGGAAVPSSRP